MLHQHAPFPAGLILHSWIGPAEMVDALAKLQGVYFSLSGHLTRMSKKKYEPMVKRVSPNRHLLCLQRPSFGSVQVIVCCHGSLETLHGIAL